MRYEGSLIQWNDERGFGWIRAQGEDEKIFVHISAFVPRPPADQRPQIGQRLEFSIGMDKGKKRAEQVSWRAASAPAVQNKPRTAQSQGQRRNGQGTASSGGWHASSRLSYSVVLVWLLLMLAYTLIWGSPKWMWPGYALMSVLTFALYNQDKWAAKHGHWRIAEKTLQTMALLGGWPGAVLGQQWLRHKSSKTEFQLQFWFWVLLHMAVMLWVLSPWGRVHWV